MKVDYDNYKNITRAEYKTLYIKAALYDALRAGGVDNWEWYSDSLRDAGLLVDEEDQDD